MFRRYLPHLTDFHTIFIIFRRKDKHNAIFGYHTPISPCFDFQEPEPDADDSQIHHPVEVKWEWTQAPARSQPYASSIQVQQPSVFAPAQTQIPPSDPIQTQPTSAQTTTICGLQPSIPAHQFSNQASSGVPIDDEYLQVARFWARELAKISPQQQIFVKKAISDVLFEGQMGTLNRHSVQINVTHIQEGSLRTHDESNNE